ncbi:MAG: hypothetical protein ABS46_07305 [Cytophagaceae bacterium SCN 52-12]|nr:MAG: hypothetical protein ABS46_07305 [Cytophagaceae bacterium SCN 52-12]
MAGNSIDPDLLARYLDGTCSPEEAAEVEEWYRRIRHSGSPPEFSQPLHFLKVRGKISEMEAARENPAPVSRTGRTAAWKRYVAAASVLLLVGVTLLPRLLKTDGKASSGEAAAVTVFTNTLSRIIKYQLPDKSTVWLHPGATLQYGETGFSSAGRKVRLTGEAFFEIVRDPANPFIVEVDKMRVRVLGTSFLVRPADSLANYEVAVVTGKVEVYSESRESGASSPSVVLNPSEKASFHLPTGAVTASRITTADPHIETWQPADLSFEDANLAEVAGQLELSFGVKVHFENSALANCVLKASFENHRLAEVLDAMSEMLELTYEINHEQILLKGNGCPAGP